jgi:hypothetical protein
VNLFIEGRDMGINNGNAPHFRQVAQSEIDQILNLVWETAVRRNPMSLVKMIDPNSVFKTLREMIRDCLTRGLSEAETCDHVRKELLHAAASGTLPRSRCDDAAAHSHPES